MRVTFKTLKSEKFEMDFDESTTVLQMKERIAQNHPDFSNETMKLVCSGKLLENGTTLSELKLTPSSFIVVMDPKKPDASPAKQPPPSQQPATPVTSSATGTAAQQTTVRPSIQSEEDEDLEAAMILATPSEREQIIQDVIDMGFDRESVLLALRASYYNADRAVEYLLSGNIPTSRTSISQTSSQSDQSEVHQTRHSSAEILRALRSQPQFQQLREVIRQNPGMLTTVIAQIGQQHPELLEAIQANEEEFIRMLAEDEPTAESSQGERDYVAVVSMTRDERAAIDRLKELGFSEAACVQAYFACDKNENDAANFLFNANLDEDDQAQ